MTRANLLPALSTRLPLSQMGLVGGIMDLLWNMQNPIPPIMLQPSKWLSLYEDFVAKNSSSVGHVESTLRSLTYIIPGTRELRVCRCRFKIFNNTKWPQQADIVNRKYLQNAVSLQNFNERELV